MPSALVSAVEGLAVAVESPEDRPVSRRRQQLSALSDGIPTGIAERLPPVACRYVADLLGRHPVELRVVPRRATKLGDHRPPSSTVPWHRITVNDDLNRYAFLVTLLHELAHLTTHVEHRSRRRLRPHGREWQGQFSRIIEPVVAQRLVPGDLIDAQNAYRMGLVNEVVDAEDLETKTMELAQKIASKSPLTVAIGKEAYYRQAELPLSEAYDYTKEVMVRNLEARDAQEGISAFIEKRHPVWCGK